jgi:hypothetical protein
MVPLPSLESSLLVILPRCSTAHTGEVMEVDVAIYFI